MLTEGAAVNIWYLAICMDCAPLLPQPFTDPAERDAWTAAHKSGTGHDVLYVEQKGKRS